MEEFGKALCFIDDEALVPGLCDESIRVGAGLVEDGCIVEGEVAAAQRCGDGLGESGFPALARPGEEDDARVFEGGPDGTLGVSPPHG